MSVEFFGYDIEKIKPLTKRGSVIIEKLGSAYSDSPWIPSRILIKYNFKTNDIERIMFHASAGSEGYFQVTFLADFDKFLEISGLSTMLPCATREDKKNIVTYADFKKFVKNAILFARKETGHREFNTISLHTDGGDYARGGVKIMSLPVQNDFEMKDWVTTKNLDKALFIAYYTKRENICEWNKVRGNFANAVKDFARYIPKDIKL